jgi:hypothetical protein
VLLGEAVKPLRQTAVVVRAMDELVELDRSDDQGSISATEPPYHRAALARNRTVLTGDTN